MLGEIIGGIVVLRFGWTNYRDKDREFFTDEYFPTNDSIMSLAIVQAN